MPTVGMKETAQSGETGQGSVLPPTAERRGPGRPGWEWWLWGRAVLGHSQMLGSGFMSKISRLFIIFFNVLSIVGVTRQ